MRAGKQKNHNSTTPNVMDHWSLLEPLYRWGAALLAKFVYQPIYYNYDKIPETGPAILICNHVSFVDGLVIQAGLNRSVRFVIDEHIYNTPVVHYFMRHNRAIPILPKRDSIKWALKEVNKALKEGDLVCIFPEGQLTYTGGLSRFKPGIEYMISQNPHVNVYPLALTGLWGSIFSRKYLDSWMRWWPRHRGQKVQSMCGDPIPAEDVTVNRLQQEVLRLKYKIQTPSSEIK